MAWITITEADLLTVLSGPELSALREAAKALGQADPVAPTIAQVADEVRGYVGGCKNNTLGSAGTIPQKLLATALDIVAVRIPNRVGKAPKPGREKLFDQAIDRLKMVARCDFDIEEPTTPTEEKSAGGGMPSIKTNRRREFDRCSQDGL